MHVSRTTCGRFAELSDAMEDSLSLFQSIGLSEAKAKDTIKNTLVSNALKSLIAEVRVKVT